MKLLLATIVTTFALCLSAFAGAQSQLDTSTNVVQATSTNTYALYGDITGNYTNGAVLNQPNAFIDVTKTTSASFEVGGYFANTAAGASNVTFAVYSTVDLKLWQLATNVVVSVPANSTNWAFTTFTVSEGGFNNSPFPDYALRSVANTNSSVSMPGIGAATNTASTFFKAYTRTGI